MSRQFVFPCISGNQTDFEFSDGLLFTIPVDIGGTAKIRAYAAQTKLGWHQIDFGYWMYIHNSEELGFLRFVGLLPQGSKALRGSRSPQPFSRQVFERYVESLVEREKRNRDRVRDEISLLIHDLRRFSNSIYQNAVATKKAIFEGESAEAAIKIENTLAAQAMLRVRTDILDLAESREVPFDEDNVQIYRKFDKVVKSFQPGCGLKSVDLSISGSSHSLSKGPECAEIIAYILVDNALKYSPANHTISVVAKETASTIHVSVTSLGPLIGDSELEKIFEKGYRSLAARSFEGSGTGYGLFLARLLVSRFKGKISCRQSGSTVRTIRGEFRDTIFEVEFPISERRSAPSHSSLDRKGPPKQLQPIEPRETKGKALSKSFQQTDRSKSGEPEGTPGLNNNHPSSHKPKRRKPRRPSRRPIKAKAAASDGN